MEERLTTTLLEACDNGDDYTVKLLLAVMDNTKNGPDTRQALMVSISQKHRECAGLLLRHGVDRNFELGGETPLSMATRMNDDITVNELLQAGADVNFRCSRPALLWATHNQNYALIRRLLQAGANVHIPCATSKITAVHYATRINDIHSLRMLLEASRRCIPLDRITNCMDAHDGNNGDVPLHIAARRSDAHPAIEALLWYGANATQRNFVGRTPEDVAIDASSRYMLAIWTHGARAPRIRRAASVPPLQALCAITIVRARVPWRVDTVPHALRAVIAETTGWAADGEWDKPRAPEYVVSCPETKR